MGDARITPTPGVETMLMAAVSVALIMLSVPSNREASGQTPTHTQGEGSAEVQYTQSCFLSGTKITTASTCETASMDLGLPWHGQESDSEWPHGCYEAEHGEGRGVYFNTYPGKD